MASTEPPAAGQSARSAGLALRVPPLALVAGAAVLMWQLPAIVALPFSGAGTAGLAAVLALLGVSICLAGVLAFRQRRTTVDPTRPEAATTLVVHGIYTRTRNPMYLGFMTALLGWAVYLGTLSSLMVLPLVVAYLTIFQIKPEEAALRQRFGPVFDAYSDRVRRWL